MKKMRAVTVIISAILFCFTFACKPPEKAEETQQEETFGAARVKVFKVKKDSISEKLNYMGLIEAIKKINITPDIGGKITEIHVKEGDRVNKGQLLAELDTRAIRLQLKQAEAAAAVTEANYKDAKRNIERMERLRKEDAVSEQQYEKIKLAYEAAEAQLQQGKASLNLVKYNLDVSLMKAPFKGIIASKNAEIGDVINPLMGGYTPISGVLTLMDFSKVKIEIDVSDVDIIRIKKGQHAILTVSAYPDQEFEGQVTLVNLTADLATKKFQVEIQLDNPEMRLRPNTFGNISLEVNTNESALIIPQKAVIENKYVFLAEGEKAIRKEISIGLQNTQYIEVVQGLKEGDMVVVEGNYGLEDGSKLEITEVVQ